VSVPGHGKAAGVHCRWTNCTDKGYPFVVSTPKVFPTPVPGIIALLLTFYLTNHTVSKLH